MENILNKEQQSLIDYYSISIAQKETERIMTPIFLTIYLFIILFIILIITLFIYLFYLSIMFYIYNYF